MKLRLLALLFPLLLSAADRPNFVWLISEDNSVHYLDLFFEGGAKTPNIAKMAESGIVFERAFSCSPVCSVARTTLITGCYAPRIGTQYHRRSAMAPMPGGLKMFPAYLREAGYYTANNSKKDYNAVEGKGVWDESSKKASWRKRGDGQPFFYKASYGTTHEGSLHFPEKDIGGKPTTTDPKKVPVQPYFPDTRTFRYTVARYHDNIMKMDEQIGGVVAQLEKDGLLEDTFIFYFGDHGGVLPRGKGYAYESGLHVPLVVRVPANYRHLTDAKPGTRSRGFVSFIDFGPTLLQLAGIEVPAQVDGSPFLGQGVSLAEVNERDTAFGYADRFDEKYDLVRTWRKGKYKYVRNFQPFNFDSLQNNYRYRMAAYREWRALHRQGKLNPVQAAFHEPRAPEALYDLEADPHETVNLAGHDEVAGVLAELRGEFNGFVKEIHDLSLIPESHMVSSEVLADPSGWGEKHAAEIAALLDIANLSLVPFAEARPGIERALKSERRWERYWACIVCSCFGKQAEPLAASLSALAAKDPENLVRTRAAEFLGLTGLGDPVPLIRDVSTLR